MTFMKANRKYVQGGNFDPKVPNGCYIVVFFLEAGAVAMNSLLPKSMEMWVASSCIPSPISRFPMGQLPWQRPPWSSS